MTLIELFLLLWSLVGGQFTWHNELPPGLGEVAPHVYGGLSCKTREAWLAPSAGLEGAVHELAHAYDCVDDGLLNGSPGHAPDIDWGMVCDRLGHPCPYWNAEWYAYEVVRTHRLH